MIPFMPRTRHAIVLAMAGGLVALSGCAPCCYDMAVTRPAVEVVRTDCATAPACPTPKMIPPAPDLATATPITFKATGYGTPGNAAQLTAGQHKLMAIRAAQVDAYRNLAEQVYGARVWGSTSVSAFITQSDSVRSYVDAFIRGARIVGTTGLADGTFEVTVELELPRHFADCLTQPATCPTPPPVASCVRTGCAVSSVNYVSN